MIYRNLIVAALLLIPLSASAAGLTEVADLVVRRSPALRGARSGARAAKSALWEARAMSLPHIAARSSIMRGDNPLFVFGSRLEQRAAEQRDFDIMNLNQPGYRTNIKTALEVGMPLFTAYQLHSYRRMGRLAVTEAESRAEGAEQMKLYQAVESHLGVLLETARFAMLEERVKSAETMADDTRRLKKKGLVLGSDFYAAEAILGKLRAERTQARYRLEASRARLAVLTGTAPGELKPAGALLPGTYSLPPEAELVDRSLRDRRDLRMARVRTSQAETAQRQSSMSLLPTVEAFAAVETATTDFDRNLASRILGVRARLPFGDPAYIPRRARAKAQVEASRSLAEEQAEAVRMELAGARAGFNGVAESLPTVQWMLEQARMSLKLFRPLYLEGRQSVMEVLRAEDALAQAEDAYLQTLYHLHAGYARLMLTAGGLDRGVVAKIADSLEAVR